MTAPQTPTPGVPLSAESEVRAGDKLRRIHDGEIVIVSRFSKLDDQRVYYFNDHITEGSAPPAAFTFIGRPDAEGWMTWSGGENPVPGQKVECHLRNGITEPGVSDEFTWTHLPEFFPQGRAVDIIAFRLTTPSDQGEASGMVEILRNQAADRSRYLNPSHATTKNDPGFISGLTTDQREGALSFSGDDTHPASDQGEEDAFDGIEGQIAAIKASPEYETESIAAEAYQVIGTIASAGGLFDHPDVQRALDYFGGDREGEILPFAMSTTPASGSDGLETVAYRVRHPRHEAYRLCFVPGPDDSAEPLATREAAEKRIGEEKARADRAAARMHKAIDKAREEEVAAQAAELRADQAESQVAALKAALETCRDPLSTAKMWARRKGGCDGAIAKIDAALNAIRQALALKEGR